MRMGGLRRLATVPPHAAPPKPPTGIKKLIAQYGYSALGVYLAISLIDIPLCWLLVHSAGEDQIRDLQDTVKGYFGYEKQQPKAGEADAETPKSSTFWTEFAVAYAFHKSLIFVRLPIAAALTPAVVRLLTRWGFKVARAAPTVAKKAAEAAAKH